MSEKFDFQKLIADAIHQNNPELSFHYEMMRNCLGAIFPPMEVLAKIVTCKRIITTPEQLDEVLKTHELEPADYMTGLGSLLIAVSDSLMPKDPTKEAGSVSSEAYSTLAFRSEVLTNFIHQYNILVGSEVALLISKPSK